MELCLKNPATGRFRSARISTILTAVSILTVTASASFAEGQTSSSETVRLLHGLAMIESDVRIGMLYAHDNMTDPTGSLLTDPHEKVWPEIKDGLLAAGVSDFDALLLEIENAKDNPAAIAVGGKILAETAKARAALNPSDADITASVIDLTRAALEGINPSGPTEVVSYQVSWSLVSVARDEVDFLVGSSDPVMAKAAVKMMLALDDVIIAMPDPAASAPVAFDPAVIGEAITKLEALAAGEI